mmetsp:Transcript_6858/g.14158  ORF Transcript_6858/g.14158 Transcript_6858/m.14158 type:complete len:229 (-) Transcript_6858:6-692(-)
MRTQCNRRNCGAARAPGAVTNDGSSGPAGFSGRALDHRVGGFGGGANNALASPTAPTPRAAHNGYGGHHGHNGQGRYNGPSGGYIAPSQSHAPPRAPMYAPPAAGVYGGGGGGGGYGRDCSSGGRGFGSGYGRSGLSRHDELLLLRQTRLNVARHRYPDLISDAQVRSWMSGTTISSLRNGNRSVIARDWERARAARKAASRRSRRGGGSSSFGGGSSKRGRGSGGGW